MVKINNSDDLKNWLENKPKEWAQVIASRIALRVLPLAGGIYDAEIDKNISDNLTISIFRANLISWAARKYTTHDISNAAVSAANAAAIEATDATDPAAYSANAIYAAARAADAAVFAADAIYAADAAYAAAGAAAFAADAADAADGAVYLAISKDAEFLQQENSVESLIQQPLWIDGYMGLLDGRWQKLKKILLAQNIGWDIWIDWYEDILGGRNHAGLPDNLAEKLDIKIVTQENDWWEQDAAKINADIKEWVEAARGEAKNLTVEDYLAKAIETASPEPFVNEKD